MDTATISIIKIDRTQSFDPVKFLGKGWSIVGQDKRSLALTELDLGRVQLVTMLRDNEIVVSGQERLKRLKKAGHIRLDAKVFQALWENQAWIPESWKEKVDGNIRYIHFEGTELRRPGSRRDVLSLCWIGGRWFWYCRWLEVGWRASDPSAVLASI